MNLIRWVYNKGASAGESDSLTILKTSQVLYYESRAAIEQDGYFIQLVHMYIVMSIK